MPIYPIQANFSRGELSPRLHARIDIEYYKASLRTCTNWTVLRHGGLRKRPGFKMVKEVKDSSKKVRLIPFIFSTLQPYVLEMGNQYVRKYSNGGIITTGGGTPTNITRANPAVVTMAGHGLSNSQRVLGTNIGGMVELNNREFIVANTTSNTFQLQGVDSSSYGAFTGGGTIKRIVETATPYLEADLFGISYAQSADVLTLADVDYQPRELNRSSDTSWSLTTPTFRNGPFLDEPDNNANGLKPDIRNVVTTGGSASHSAIFDGSEASKSSVNATSWTASYTLPAPAVCDNYYVQQGHTAPNQIGAVRTPTAWTFEGYDGSAWVVLDRQAGEGSWGLGEKRFYEFQNARAFEAYRMIFTAGSTDRENNLPWYELSEVGWGYNGDYAPTMTLTFDNTTNINNGSGFQTNDVGRTIRLRGADGKWRWFVIAGRTSTTVVTGRMYGYALPDTDKIFRWQLGAWKAGQWPGVVSFYENRRVFAKSNLEPNVIWPSKTGDFYDYGESQPLVDDDGMRLRILSGRVNAITWLEDAETLAIGTVGDIRKLGPANTNAGFGATNFDQRTSVFTRAGFPKPVRVGSVILFTDYFGKKIRELVYDLNQDGFIAPDVTILGDHLLSSTVVEMAYQETPDSIVWIVTGNGDLVALTYEREQKVVALTRVRLAPGDAGTTAAVESVCSIPGTLRDEVWISVKRTINGVTKRYIETLAPEFEDMALEDGVFLDSSLTYSGAPATVVNGLNHLIGKTVYALADGQVYRNLTVAANGTITLPYAASKIHVGLPYTASIVTLPLNEVGQQDGVAISRRKMMEDVRISVMDTVGLKVKGLTSSDFYEIFRRDEFLDPTSGAMSLRTGNFPMGFDMSWREDGQFETYSDDPFPATIRAFIFGVDGEP
jgi:hypothetical protein